MNSVSKTVKLSGRLRPGGCELRSVDTSGLTISVDGATAIGTVRMLPKGHDPTHEMTVLMLPDAKNWGSRDPWKADLLSPELTILSEADGSASVRVEFNIPQYPDWLRTRLMSSMDGVIFIRDVPTGLSGIVEAGDVLKQTWSETVFTTTRLPDSANTDFIWVEHEYQFGGILNSLLTPLPPGTTTTTTTESTTTTTTSTDGTTSTTSTTEASTTAATTAATTATTLATRCPLVDTGNPGTFTVSLEANSYTRANYDTIIACTLVRDYDGKYFYRTTMVFSHSATVIVFGVPILYDYYTCDGFWAV